MPFTQTTRSLDADQAKSSFLAVIILSGLLLIWLVWFFVGQIAVYESVTTLRLPLNEFVSVTFPAQAYDKFNIGQHAILYVHSQGGTGTTTLSATVVDLQVDSQDGVVVSLLPKMEQSSPEHFFESYVTQIDIAVDYQSPLALVINAVRP